MMMSEVEDGGKEDKRVDGGREKKGGDKSVKRERKEVLNIVTRIVKHPWRNVLRILQNFTACICPTVPGESGEQVLGNATLQRQ